MKKEEMMLKATQMLAKGKFKLKKASPTIMIVGAAIGGVTAAVLACKATLKAEEIIAEHNAQVETIHTTKAQVDSGEMQLKDGETYTADDMKKDITATYGTARRFMRQTCASTTITSRPGCWERPTTSTTSCWTPFIFSRRKTACR